MTGHNEAVALARAVLDGSLTLEAALEEHLEGEYDGPVDDLLRLLGYALLGRAEHVLDLGGDTRTVAEFVEEFSLTPFVRLIDQQDEFRFAIGDLVSYHGQTVQVIGRRPVTPLAAPRFDDWELLIEALDTGRVGFVGEGEVEAVDEDAGDG